MVCCFFILVKAKCVKCIYYTTYILSDKLLDLIIQIDLISCFYSIIFSAF